MRVERGDVNDDPAQCSLVRLWLKDSTFGNATPASVEQINAL